MYLTTVCILSVVEADRSCVVQVSTSPVHISSTTTTSTDVVCGSVDQPWTLRAPTGQHIRVHLLDFTSDQQTVNDELMNSDDDDESSCREYGHVTDEEPAAAAGRRQTSVICGDGRRNKLIVESRSNVLHVVFNQPIINNTNINFLLRFYGQSLACVKNWTVTGGYLNLLLLKTGLFIYSSCFCRQRRYTQVYQCGDALVFRPILHSCRDSVKTDASVLWCVLMRGCWGSGRVSGCETAGWCVDETYWFRQGRDWLLHVASSLGSTLCWQSVRRRHRQLYSTSVNLLKLFSQHLLFCF